MKNNQRGFGLVQVLVVAGMIGGLAVVVMNINKLGFTATSKTEANQELTLFIDDIDKRMKGTSMCSDTFSGRAMADEIDLTELTFNGNPIFPVDAKVGMGKVTVRSYKLVNDSLPIGSEGAGTAYLEVTLQKSKASGGRVITKRIPLYMRTDSAGNIIDCVSDLNALILNIKTEICADLGGTMVSGTCDTITPEIGDVTSLTCDADSAGRIAYDAAGNALQVCDGSTWIVVGGGGEPCAALNTDVLPTDPGGNVSITAGEHLEVKSGTCSHGGTAVFQCKDGTYEAITQNCVIAGP